MKNSPKKNKRAPKVHYPKEIETNNYNGKLYGYYHSDSNEYNIINFGKNIKESIPYVGKIVKDKDDIDEKKVDELIGFRENDQIIFRQGLKICNKQPYELLLNVFSRNSGIIETSEMLNKSVIISGLGSVGSLVALELARSGVGKYLLIDNDTIEYHNICRHQCGIKDVGKFKVNAISERILKINPTAIVVAKIGIFEDISESVFNEFIDSDTVIVGCADNREGDLYANRISLLYNIPFVSIGFWERAFAGEIFYSIPGRTPCYSCVFGNTKKNISTRISTNRRFYTNEDDLALTKFEPGISTDINFITIIGIKLILDLMNLNNQNYIPRLFNTLSQFTLICNTNNPVIGGEQAEIFSYPLQITTSLKVNFSKHCNDCNLLKGKKNGD